MWFAMKRVAGQSASRPSLTRTGVPSARPTENLWWRWTRSGAPGSEPFEDSNWLFEFKYDGFRALCFQTPRVPMTRARCPFCNKRADPRFICERFNIVLERVGAGAARHTLHRARGGYARSQETDPRKVAASLIGRILEKQRQEWVPGKPADWAMEAFALGRGDAYGLLPRPGSQGTYSLRLAYVVHSASRPRMSAPTQADGPRSAASMERAAPMSRLLFRKRA